MEPLLAGNLDRSEKETDPKRRFALGSARTLRGYRGWKEGIENEMLRPHRDRRWKE